jgi:hypothetical protein
MSEKSHYNLYTSSLISASALFARIVFGIRAQAFDRLADAQHLVARQDSDMTSISANAAQSELDSWLAHLGFIRGNPFATAEADQERTLLPEFFVDVEGYEQILGDRTIIVFAPRGAGKSALRVVLSSQAAPITLEATTLAVEFSDFDELIAMRQRGQDLTAGDYMSRLLRAGVKALLDTLCGSPIGEIAGEEAIRNRQRRAVRIAALLPPALSRLKQALRLYHPSLLDPMPMYERLHILDPRFAPDWAEFIAAMERRQIHAVVTNSVLANDPIAHLLADLSDFPDIADDSDTSPVERLAAFVGLIRAAGLTSVHFLIDRLDEHIETVNDPALQADILEPLLAHLQVLELPGAAFKFFLWQAARDILLERPTVRRDRLTDRAVTVAWDMDHLRQLLRVRLTVYSAGQIRDLIQLCRGVRVMVGRDRQSIELGAWMEDELLNAAQGSPRRLLIAAQLLCQAHVRKSGPEGLLEQTDWEFARQELRHKMPLPLQLSTDLPMVRIGDRRIKLTPQEQRILKTLSQAPDLCEREMLANKVWGGIDGVSDEAINKAIERLRTKLGDDPDAPIYIRTEKNLGFKLTNYAIE